MRLLSCRPPETGAGLVAVLVLGVWGCTPVQEGNWATFTPAPNDQVQEIEVDTGVTPEDEIISVVPDLNRRYVQPPSWGSALDPSLDYAGKKDDRCKTWTNPQTGEELSGCVEGLNLCQELLLSPYREAFLDRVSNDGALGGWDVLNESELEYTPVLDLTCNGECSEDNPPLTPDENEDAISYRIFRQAHISDLHASLMFHPASGAGMDGVAMKSFARPLSLSPTALAHMMSQFHHDIEALGVYWVSVTGDMMDGLGKQEAELAASLVYGDTTIDVKAPIILDPINKRAGCASGINAGNGHVDYYPTQVGGSSAIKAPVPGNHINYLGSLGLMDPDKAGDYSDTVQTWNGFLNYMFSMDRYFWGSGIQFVLTEDDQVVERFVTSISSYVPPPETCGAAPSYDANANAPITVEDWIQVFKSAMDTASRAVIPSLDDRTVMDQRGNWSVDLSRVPASSGKVAVPFHMINVNTVFPFLWEGVLTRDTRDFIRRECEYARNNGLIAVIASHHGLDDIMIDVNGDENSPTDFMDLMALLGVEDLLYDTLGDEMAQYLELLIAEYGINTDETIADIVAQTGVVAIQVVGHDHLNDFKIRYGRTQSPGAREGGGETGMSFESVPVRPMLESHAPAAGVNGSYVLYDFNFVPETEQHDAYLYIDRTLVDIQREPTSDFAQRLDLDAYTGCGVDAEARKGDQVDRRARIYLTIPNETEDDHLYYQSLVDQLTAVADYIPQN